VYISVWTTLVWHSCPVVCEEQGTLTAFRQSLKSNFYSTIPKLP